MWEDCEDILDAVIRARLLGWFYGLAKAGAVIDSREQYWHFHKVSSYPTTFLNDLSQDEEMTQLLEDIENGDVVVEQNPLVDQGGESNEDAEESTDDKADTTDN